MIPKWVVTAALMVTQTALTMSQRIKGPRLDELKVTVADYGTPIPRFWGIRRFETPIFWAEDLREEKHTSKTKGGKYDEYKYFATFAVAIADNPIDAVTRIWLDRRLCFDVTREGPISVAAALGNWINSLNQPVKLSNGRNMRVYLGTEDQPIDPRMETWCEDRYGEDSCPAYRGVSYIVFEDIPLEDFGNRIPQVTVEAVSVKAAQHPYETKTTVHTSNGNFSISPSGNWLAYWVGSGGQIEWWDVATRTKIGVSPSPGMMTGTSPFAAMASDGTAYQVGAVLPGADVYLFETPPLGNPAATLTDAATFQLQCTRVLEKDGVPHVFTAYEDVAGYLSGAAHIDHVQSARDFCIDSSGNLWGLFHPVGASSDFTIQNLVTGDFYTVAGAARTGPTAAFFCHVDEYGHFYVATDGNFYLIDDAAFTVKATGTAGFSGSLPANNAEQNPYLLTIWRYASGAFKEYSLEDGSLIRSLDASDWASITRDDGWVYDPVSHAIWNRQASTQSIYIQYLDRIGSDGVPLSAVVDSVCGWCDLTEKDTSALTQTVHGYSVTQGTGKDMIDPLLTIHDVDARPHDFEVQFVNRGSAPVGTILTGDFVREGDQDRYKVTIRQDTDLPKKITVNFADKAKDQQVNTAIAQRPLDAVDSQRAEVIDLSTMVAGVDEAQQLADRYFRRVWNSREEISNALTAQKLALEPGDVTTLSLDGVARNVKLEKMTIAGGRIDCTFIRDETSFAAVNSATTGAVMDGRDDEVIVIPPPVRGFVIDAPLAVDSDSDINPLLYAGVGPYGQLPYSGAAILRGDDGTYDDLFKTVPSKATWGICKGRLKTANPWLWDRGNTVNVSLQSGSLTSVTEAEVDADPTLNLIVLGSVNGWEYLNFTTATLESDGTYTLSGFKRGRRGTEGVVGSHVTGDCFILVSTLVNEQMGMDDVGDALSFKAQSVGRLVDAAPAIDLTFSAATLKPYAPARVKWTTDGADMFGEIIRRTRVGGSWNGGSTIPLSENSEAYEVDIYNGATFKRTISVTGNTFTYSGTDIAADGNTVGVTPSFNAYQISDAVGRGFALAA